MESIASTTSSTAGQRIGPRPTPPARPLTARPVARDIDWDGHIPTAPYVPAYDDAWGRPSAWAAFGDDAA